MTTAVKKTLPGSMRVVQLCVLLGKICSIFFLCHSWCLKIVRTRKKTVVQKKKSTIRLCLYTQIRISVADGCFVFWGQQSPRIKCEHVARWKRFLSAMNVRIVFSHLVCVPFAFGAPPIIRLFALSWWRCFVARLFRVLRRNGESSMIDARTER